MNMAQQSSQIQLHREMVVISEKIDRLELEVKLLLKKVNKKDRSDLDKGLKELKEGKGRLYKSLQEWSAGMKSRK
jgi:hypothetical protein